MQWCTLNIHVCAQQHLHALVCAHTRRHTVHGLLQQFDGHLITDVFSLLWLVSAAQSTQDKYAIYICSQPGMLTHLNSAMTLEQVNEKYWKINKPMEMFYLDTTKAQELAMKKNPPTGISTVDKWRGMGSPSSLDRHLLKLHYGVGVGELTCLVLLLPHCRCTPWDWALTVNTLKVIEGADWWFAPMNNRNTLDCLRAQMGQFVAYSQKAFPPVFFSASFIFICVFDSAYQLLAKALTQVFHSDWNTGLSTSHGYQSQSFGKVLCGSIDQVFRFTADTMIQQKISVFRSVFHWTRATKETVLYRPVWMQDSLFGDTHLLLCNMFNTV